MKTFHRSAAVFLICACMAGSGYAEEKNGMVLTVVKKTVNREAGDTPSKKSKTQTLGVTIRSNTIRAFPEGEVRWTLLVHKSYVGGWYKYTGTESLKSLRSGDVAEMQIGEVRAGRYRTEYADYRDRVEYQVAVVHGNKETISVSSTPNFAALAATASVPEGADRVANNGKGNDKGDKPAEGETPAADGAGKPIAGKGAAKPGDPGPAPGKDVPMPGKDAAMPPKPAPAVAENTKPTPAAPESAKPAPATPPGEPDPAVPAGKPFDFFNLDKTKKKPAAN